MKQPTLLLNLSGELLESDSYENIESLYKELKDDPDSTQVLDEYFKNYDLNTKLKELIVQTEFAKNPLGFFMLKVLLFACTRLSKEKILEFLCTLELLKKSDTHEESFHKLYNISFLRSNIIVMLKSTIVDHYNKINNKVLSADKSLVPKEFENLTYTYLYLRHVFYLYVKDLTAEQQKEKLPRVLSLISNEEAKTDPILRLPFSALNEIKVENRHLKNFLKNYYSDLHLILEDIIGKYPDIKENVSEIETFEETDVTDEQNTTNKETNITNTITNVINETYNSSNVTIPLAKLIENRAEISMLFSAIDSLGLDYTTIINKKSQIEAAFADFDKISI